MSREFILKRKRFARTRLRYLNPIRLYWSLAISTVLQLAILCHYLNTGYQSPFLEQRCRITPLRLQSTGGWKPLRDPQEIIFDSITSMRYVIIDNR